VTQTHVVWKTKRGIPARSSPVLVGGLLFMADERGVATCLDARTGTVVWEKRMGGEHNASALYAEGRVYFFDTKAATHVVQADRKGQLLGRNLLDDGCMASPAIAGKALYVRTKTHLYRIEQSP
jgi:outer membrane protein assembly factor BamB